MGQEPRKHNVTDFRESTEFALLSPKNALKRNQPNPIAYNLSQA